MVKYFIMKTQVSTAERILQAEQKLADIRWYFLSKGNDVVLVNDLRNLANLLNLAASDIEIGLKTENIVKDAAEKLAFIGH